MFETFKFLNNILKRFEKSTERDRFSLGEITIYHQVAPIHQQFFIWNFLKFWNNIETRFENFCVPANAISLFENPHFLSHRPPSNLGREAFFL